jgi:hypothetical protein
MWWGAAIEAPDPALAAFYSMLLDWPVVHKEPGTAGHPVCLCLDEEG